VGKIIVIGAGVAGLAAAARLSGGDRSVTVLEQASAVGGALGGSGGEPGDKSGRAGSAREFDTGAHTLTMPAVYRDLFLKTGSRKKSAASSLEENVGLLPVDPVRRYLFADGSSLDLPNASRARVLESFDAAFGPGAGREWLRLVEHGSAVWALLRPAWYEAPRATGRDLWTMLATRSGRRTLTPRTSLRALARSWFTDPRLGLLLDEYALGCGADPRRAPGILAAAPYLEHIFGAWRITGGLNTLTDALSQRAMARGAEIRLSCPVSRITVAADGSVDGVLLADGERLAADTVIAAVDPSQLAALTSAGTGATQLADHGADRYGYSHSVFTLLLRVPGAAEMPHETVLFAEHDPAAVEDRLDAVFGTVAHAHPNPTVRVCVSAQYPEAWAVHVAAPRHSVGSDTNGVPGQGAIDWTAPGLAADYADTLVTLLTRRGLLRADAVGMDAVTRDTAKIERIITPADREQSTSVPGGAAYGPAAHSLRSALLRSPVAQPTPGLFHIGAGARPGAGLPFAALSAWHVSELLSGPR
jgi:phytoene dehydrogenase-like protein